MERRIESFIHSKSKTFLAFCFCFILGVGIFSALELPAYWLYRIFLLVFLVGCLLIFFWQDLLCRFILLCVLFFVLGAGRFLITIPQNPNNLFFHTGETLTIKGVINDEPLKYLDETRYVLKTPQGKLLLSLPFYSTYGYGDKLELQCRLDAPQNFPTSNFRYDNYLARQGIFAICRLPKIILVTPAQGFSPMKIIFKWKEFINKQVEKLWPEPNSSFMAGLLYGARTGLPDDLLNNFSRVGITHIIAISGYNISIIAVGLMSLLIACGLYRQRAFWICAIGIILFVIFTGASASVVRAGIMGMIVLIAGQVGRVTRIWNILAITAAFMLLANPYILVWDAGFQLSFLATIGIVFLSPLLEQKLQRWKFLGNTILTILSTTFSAIIFTLPLILFQFGRLSTVAPIANVAVLWVVPYLMLIGFTAIIFSFIFFPLGQVIAWVAGLGLGYIIKVTELLASFKFASIEWQFPLWAMVIAYGLLIVVIASVAKQSPR